MVSFKERQAGDDTWHTIVKEYIDQSEVLPSLDIHDLDSVDIVVFKNFIKGMNMNYSFTLGHCLGLDHTGHSLHANCQQSKQKLKQYNNVLTEYVENMGKGSLLLVFGDHGQTDLGNHGSNSASEVSKEI